MKIFEFSRYEYAQNIIVKIHVNNRSKQMIKINIMYMQVGIFIVKYYKASISVLQIQNILSWIRYREFLACASFALIVCLAQGFSYYFLVEAKKSRFHIYIYILTYTYNFNFVIFIRMYYKLYKYKEQSRVPRA